MGEFKLQSRKEANIGYLESFMKDHLPGQRKELEPSGFCRTTDGQGMSEMFSEINRKPPSPKGGIRCLIVCLLAAAVWKCGCVALFRTSSRRGKSFVLSYQAVTIKGVC